MALTHPKLGNLKLYSKRQKRCQSRISPCQIASVRLHDLARLFHARYGIILPNDDAGRDDMMVAVNHLATLTHPKQRIGNWLDLWCPWLSRGESALIIAKALTRQQYWSADQLAWRLRLTLAERTVLGITTIGAIDCPKRERTKRRKAKAAARAKAWRDRTKAVRTQHKLI